MNKIFFTILGLGIIGFLSISIFPGHSFAVVSTSTATSTEVNISTTTDTIASSTPVQALPVDLSAKETFTVCGVNECYLTDTYSPDTAFNNCIDIVSEGKDIMICGSFSIQKN